MEAGYEASKSNVLQDHTHIHLRPIVEEVLKFQRTIIPANINIRSDIDENCRQIKGDPIQIYQVLMNLCTNAAHAMEEKGGTLAVGLHKAKLAANDQKTEPDLPAGTYVRLSVIDTGCGMTPEIVDMIFDPYFTTKEVGKGSGMGMWVVHGIIKNHGGFVKVKSEPGKGSTFFTFFPCIEEEIISKETNEFDDIPTGTEKILFIDDMKMMTTFGKGMLEKLGYFVTTKNDSSEALSLFQRDPVQFDLVITDQIMPKLTGTELAKYFLNIRPDIPIILCTAYSGPIDELKAQEIGIREYVQKPVNIHSFARLIRKVLDGDKLKTYSKGSLSRYSKKVGNK